MQRILPTSWKILFYRRCGRVFIVLADRYIYTLMARDMVRGMNGGWLKKPLWHRPRARRGVLPFRPRPRNWCSATSPRVRHWITGRAAWISECRADMFDSFLKYQTAMQMAFRQLQKTYGFTIVDGNRSVDFVTKELRKKNRRAAGGGLKLRRVRRRRGCRRGHWPAARSPPGWC